MTTTPSIAERMAFPPGTPGRLTSPNSCRKILSADPIRHCDRPGTTISLPCPSGRPNAEGGPYCDAHGGQERAQREAECDWNYQAPASVGDADAVLAAGNLSLNSRDAYLVIRQEAGKEGGVKSDRWLAWLGLGSLLTGVRGPGSTPHRRRGEAKADYQARIALGGFAFRSREEALAEGARVWRESLTAHVAEIRRARGGTLSWGIPVEPLAEPIVVEATGRNAWDVARSQPRKARIGLATISGVRPSGEAA